MECCSRSIKAVVFDIGATLVTGPDVAPNKIIASLLGNVTASQVSSVIMTRELPSADMAVSVLEDHFGPRDQKTRIAIMELWESQAAAPVEIAGACDCVNRLRDRGYKIGLLSDIWSPYYRGVELSIPSVVECADAVALSCRLGNRKPCEGNFRAVLDMLGLRAEETVMVGDTYTHDIYPAVNIGMAGIWVMARPEREIESILGIINGNLPGPTRSVGDIKEVYSAIIDIDKVRSIP